MKKFFLKILILLLPFIVFFSLPLYVLIISGEIYTNKYLLKIHNSQKSSLIGMAYNNPDRFLKLNTTLQRSPRVLALGSSRVLQFRSFFFNNENDFYNAGRAVDNLKEFRYFINKIPVTTQPKIIILGLDQYFFNANFDDLSKNDFTADYEDKYSFLAYLFDNSFTIWKQVFSHKIKLNITRNFSIIGLNAVLQNNGFRYDGSYYSGQIISHPESNEDFLFKDTYQRIKSGTRRFQYTNEINKNALSELDSLFHLCKKRGIHVIAFLPPFAHSVVEMIKSKGKKLSYMFELGNAVKLISDRYKYNIFDFTDIASLGASDKETIDGFHGSEKAYLRILIALQQDEVLSTVCNKQYLQYLLKKSYSDLEVLKYSISNK